MVVTNFTESTHSCNNLLMALKYLTPTAYGGDNPKTESAHDGSKPC